MDQLCTHFKNLSKTHKVLHQQENFFAQRYSSEKDRWLRGENVLKVYAMLAVARSLFQKALYAFFSRKGKFAGIWQAFFTDEFFNKKILCYV